MIPKLKIKALRQAKGISQRELAGLVGVTNPAVHAWETGENYPTVSSLFALARALECSVSDLFESA